MANLNETMEQVHKLYDAINSSNAVLDKDVRDFDTPLPVSFDEIKKEVYKTITRFGPEVVGKMGPQISRAVSKGRIEEAVPIVLITGGVAAAAYLIDGTSRVVGGAVAKRKAKAELLSYYGMLAVKQDMVIEEQKRLIDKISSNAMLTEKELEEAKEKLNKITEVFKTNAELLNHRIK